MEDHTPDRNLTKGVLVNLPTLSASIGLASAIDGDTGLSDAVGWWVTGWKAMIGGVAFEAFRHYKSRRGPELAQFQEISDRFRGSRGFARLAEFCFSSYAMHQLFDMVYFQGDHQDPRYPILGTLGLYAVSAIAKMRN